MSKDSRLPREFNPLHPRNLARAIADALNDEPLLPLPPAERFEGAGVYALYYLGQFEPYEPIADGKKPIYVGKAIPKGARKGSQDIDAPPGTVLADRLTKHANSIAAAKNLEPADFNYRALVVDPFYANVAELLLIQRWKPIWNGEITGFGINAPGGRRETQYRSLWDTLHPGRAYAVKLAPNPQKPADIRKALKRLLTQE